MRFRGLNVLVDLRLCWRGWAWNAYLISLGSSKSLRRNALEKRPDFCKGVSKKTPEESEEIAPVWFKPLCASHTLVLKQSTTVRRCQPKKSTEVQGQSQSLLESKLHQSGFCTWSLFTGCSELDCSKPQISRTCWWSDLPCFGGERS